MQIKKNEPQVDQYSVSLADIFAQQIYLQVHSNSSTDLNKNLLFLSVNSVVIS